MTPAVAGAPSSVTPPSKPAVGATIGRYRLEALLGQGSASTVYRALDTHLHRRVALKVMRSGLADDPDARRRFLAESRLAAGLDHPGVVSVLDVGDIDGVPFAVLGLVRGRDLRWLLEREGQLDPRLVAVLLGDVAETLDVVHARDCVHGDLKPANILVGAAPGRFAPRVVVADFLGVTTEEVVGTPGYAAPEQLRGERIDARADVYALGAVLFECLTGRLPREPHRGHDGDIDLTPMHAPLPRLTKRRPDLPGELDEVLARALAPRASDRYETCGALMAAARPALERGARPTVIARTAAPRAGASVTTRVDSGPRRSRRLGAGVGVVVALAVALLAVQLHDAGSGVANGSGAAGASRINRDRTARRLAVRALKPRVPGALRSRCRSTTPQLAGARAELTCMASDGTTRVVYGLYADRESLDDAFALEAPEGRSVSASTGATSCAAGTEDEREWRADASSGKPDGRYRCLIDHGAATITWSSWKALVLAVAQRRDGDLAALFAWWRREPGPIAARGGA